MSSLSFCQSEAINQFSNLAVRMCLPHEIITGTLLLLSCHVVTVGLSLRAPESNYLFLYSDLIPVPHLLLSPPLDMWFSDCCRSAKHVHDHHLMGISVHPSCAVLSACLLAFQSSFFCCWNSAYRAGDRQSS